MDLRTHAGLKGTVYTRPRNFQKQHKTGSTPLSIKDASVHYSTGTSKCKIKFTLHPTGHNDSDLTSRLFINI